MSSAKDQLHLRQPTATDGANLFELVAQCPPLDGNSMYCNLLQCSHFADTSVAAETDGELVGFISAYRVPERRDTLFVWQVAVGASARGRGLASRMLAHIVERPACRDIRWLETTITPDNRASHALFQRFASAFHAGLEQQVLFERERHFRGSHDSELLTRIGPLQRATAA
ncbi:MAG: diaminobutyrate acetyltransferase [Halioglobus sp.]|nr:diaminobutyrate acetyltransferase [Halioglobus sp.]